MLGGFLIAATKASLLVWVRVDLSWLLVERRYVLVLLTAENRYSADDLVAGVMEIIFTSF